MIRSRQTTQEIGINALNAWVDWEVTHIESSALGFGRITPEGRAVKEAIGVQLSEFFSSKDPEVLSSRLVRKAYMAIRAMNPDHKLAVYCKYRPEIPQALWEHYGKGAKHEGKWTKEQQEALFSNTTGLSGRMLRTTVKEAEQMVGVVVRIRGLAA